MMVTRMFAIALMSMCVCACSGGGSANVPVPSTMPDTSAPAMAARIDETDGIAAAAAAPPYRVHAFLEDSAGNAGCLYSANYAAVRNEADLAEFGGSSNGRHPCPGSFNALRRSAGFKVEAYNDIAEVGNAMPISAIHPAYYMKNQSCSGPFVQPSGGSVNPSSAGREIPDFTHFATQIASDVNTYESTMAADYFVNDNFGNIGEEGISTNLFCPGEFSTSSYAAAFPSFLNALSKPQIVNLASTYRDAATNGVAASHVAMVSSEEGLIHFKRGAMFDMADTVSSLNRFLQLQAANIHIALIQYNPRKPDGTASSEFPTGFSTMYDQRLWNYAGGWLILTHYHFYMWTANEGTATNSGATVEPEYYLVPQQPLVSVQPGGAAGLRVGNVLVREYRQCYYKSRSIGACAMVLNPNTGANTIPALKQTYGHSVVLSGEGALPALTGVNGGISTPADTGTINLSGPRVASLAAGRAAILTH